MIPGGSRVRQKATRRDPNIYTIYTFTGCKEFFRVFVYNVNQLNSFY